MRRAPILLGVALTIATAPSAAQWNPSDSVFFREVFRIPGHYVNDHALVRAAGVWHLFYTFGEIARRPWYEEGNEIAIGHATSADLEAWTALPPALAIDSLRDGRRAHCYAPTVVERDGRYHIFYAINDRGYGAGEVIRTATSLDLLTWTRSVDVALRPDSAWAAYNERGLPVSCRDPFVMALPGGGWVMYYVARLRVDPAVHGGLEQACVAAAVSSDLVTWIDRGPVLTRAVRGDDENRWAHPESPCVVLKDGRYYLFWKGGNGTRYVISSDPLDFQGLEEHTLATSHASRIVEHDGRWIITSCSRDIGDVLHRTSDRTRGLMIGELDWHGLLPRLGGGERVVRR